MFRYIMSGQCLVVYYSKTGNTKIVAEAIAKRMGGDICEVSEQGVAQSGFDPSGYGLVVVGTPVNGFSTALPIQGFLKENAAKLQKVAFFATYSLYPSGAFNGMAKLAGKKPMVTEKFKSGDIKLGKIDAKVEGFVSALKR